MFKLKKTGIRKLLISFPAPRVPAKAFACICVTIFYTLYESGLLSQGRERYSAAKNNEA